jgi:hypothetical protein
MLSLVQMLVTVFGTTDRTSSSLLRTVVAIFGADSSIISARLIMSSLAVPYAEEIMAIIYYWH